MLRIILEYCKGKLCDARVCFHYCMHARYFEYVFPENIKASKTGDCDESM